MVEQASSQDARDEASRRCLFVAAEPLLRFLFVSDKQERATREHEQNERNFTVF
ncbi:MAG: hypothetical protein LBD68_07265 [Zoogloeaceae bacterium]|jgi:hypothetical protein|nr:hypothetical protein [Zoogloeaceae bacterium]